MGIKNYLFNKYKISNILTSSAFYFFFIIIFATFSLINNRFFSVKNLSLLLLQSSTFLLLTTGVTFVILVKEFDLSGGSVAFISASVGAYAIQENWVSPMFGIFLILLTGIILGALNGIIITRFKVPSFVTTLGIMIGGRGLGLIIVGNKAHISIPIELKELSRLKLGPVYVEVIIVLIMMIIAQLILSYTPLGKKIYAIGDNVKAAESLGINSKTIKLILFIVSGLFAALAGLVYLTQIGEVHTVFGNGWEFTAISMAVIGGVSLFGGEGKVLPGVLFGVVLLLMINNGLNIFGASPYLYPFIRGSIIFLAIFIDSFRYRRKQLKYS